MPLTNLSLGIQIDTPMLSEVPVIWRGVNIRVRAGHVETIGLFGPLKDVAGDQIQLGGANVHRKIFTTPSTTTGQILGGSMSNVTLVQYDPASTVGTGTRWETFDVTPTSLPPVPPPHDGLTEPSSGRVDIPPVWWFDDQDDLVVGNRANVADDPPYVWDRNQISNFAPIQLARNPNDPFWPEPIDSGNPVSPAPTPLPTGAVGGGIVNRILVLLGCTSFTDPDPSKAMTIRWSDRFNFGQWTPSDITLSGEMQLEGGSRIVGGGVTGFGVVAWTDKRMALLTETESFSVFARRYIDGTRGLLANQSWAESDGQIWWLDETRTLNVFDGGRARQIINTNKNASIERLSDAQSARVYIKSNHEFGEIIIHYPSGEGTECDAQIVYNYLFDCWYLWDLQRGAWVQRYGVIPNLGVDDGNFVWRHDLDATFAFPWSAFGQGASNPDEADVEPITFQFESNMITQASPSFTSWRDSKITMDVLPSPATGAVDSFDVEVIGYREPSLTSFPYSETQTFDIGDTMKDYRVGGKALRFVVTGTNVKTVFRFGKIDVAGGMDGER